MQLDPEQQAAATSAAETTVVLAGAGSGKTRVLTARALHLLRHTAPENVLCVTFTTAAAEEMRTRLEAETREAPEIRTLHSWCAKLARKHPQVCGRAPGITLYDDVDAVDVLRMCARDARVRNWDTAEPATLRENALVTSLYAQRLRQSNALDFDGLEDGALRILRAGCGADTPAHVLVDEAQDLSPKQLELMLALQARTRFFVGDPRQAIYGFRGSSPIVWASLVQHGTVCLLTQNYRAQGNVVDAANHVAGEWGPLSATRPPAAPITFGDEPNGLTAAIDRARDAGCAWRDIAVLARRWRDLRWVQSHLAALDAPYRRGKGWDRWDSPEGRRLARLVALAANPTDDNLVALIDQSTGTDPSVILQYREAALRTRTPLLATMARSDYRWLAVSELLAGLKAGATPDQIPTRDHLGALIGGALHIDDAETRRCLEDTDNPRRNTFARFRNWWLFGRRPQDRLAELDDDAVRLLTVHGSKGLEFKAVVMVNCVDGVYPRRRQDADSEEDRRVLYVGMTRARDQLTLLRPPISPRRGGPPAATAWTPFLRGYT